MLAWHFIADDRMLRDRSMKVAAGYMYTYAGKPVLCEQGLHASERAIDALQYAPGAVVCRVECGGVIKHGDDKLVCTQRTVLWMADATEALHLFACDVAEKALREASMEDARSWAAIEAKRKWLRGEVTDSELSAARAAAWEAARDAAGAAAWAAARDAAWEAAWEAAKEAAWEAARAAAWAAARDAAWEAAWDAAWDAARDAAWEAQNALLTARLEGLA